MPNATPCQDKGSKRPTARSRELRNNATDAEKLLWTKLSARQVAGIRFNRQFPIGPFICDFVSRAARLVIELDGGQHDAQAIADRKRTAFLGSQGYRVIRFWNNDVLGNIESVVAEIERVLKDISSPNPSRKREGNALRRAMPPVRPFRLQEGPGEGMPR